MTTADVVDQVARAMTVHDGCRLPINVYRDLARVAVQRIQELRLRVLLPVDEPGDDE